MNSFDTEQTNYSVCPYCGFEDIYYHESTTHNEMLVGWWYIVCPECDNKYYVDCDVITEFYTRKEGEIC